ncbi:hypothetical protein O181_129726, partial [Austropuccinia psidii MF-1]|nr:hypothetical protein [Austropuccinia psidii MF-1]
MIYSETWEDHVHCIDRVLSKFTPINLNISLKKCNFGQQELLDLGHKVSGLSLEIHQNKVAALLQKPVAKSIKEMQSFPGFASYYRNQIKNFAHIASSLYKLCSKDVVFQIAKQRRDAYERIKYELTNAPVLILTDFEPGLAYRKYPDWGSDLECQYPSSCNPFKTAPDPNLGPAPPTQSDSNTFCTRLTPPTTHSSLIIVTLVNDLVFLYILSLDFYLIILCYIDSPFRVQDQFRYHKTNLTPSPDLTNRKPLFEATYTNFGFSLIVDSGLWPDSDDYLSSSIMPPEDDSSDYIDDEEDCTGNFHGDYEKYPPQPSRSHQKRRRIRSSVYDYYE